MLSFGTAAEFCDILETRRLSAVFQPIVDTALGHIPGYEALIRGPESSRWRCSASSFSISVPWC